MASRQSLPLPQRKARSERNCVDTISKLLKEEIDALVLEKVIEGPNKAQFHVEVVMIQNLTVQDWDTGNFIRSTLFLNTMTLTVYFEGIAGDQYFEMIGHMFDQFNSFSSHGSEGVIDQIKNANQFRGLLSIKSRILLRAT